METKKDLWDRARGYNEVSRMHRSSRNRSFLSDTEEDASVAVASRQATSTNTASRDPRGTPEPRDPPNVVLIKRTTHKTVRIETTVVTEEFAPVPLQTTEPVPPRAVSNALVGIRSNERAKVKSDNTTSRASSRNFVSAIRTPTTSQRSSTLVTDTTTDESTDSSDSDSASPILVQRIPPDTGLSPPPVRERVVPQAPRLHEAPTPPLDLSTKIKVSKGKARSLPLNLGQIPRQHHHIPNPAELQEYEASYYYIVTVGQVVGIFSVWEFVNAAVSGVSGASQSRCSTWSEAFERYSTAFNRGLVKRRVIRGSPFDDGFDDDDVRSDGTELAAGAGPSTHDFSKRR